LYGYNFAVMSKGMNYEKTLEWLYTQLPLFSRVGAAAYKADLDNTIAICSFLGNPQHKFKSIHVAGTNGKGSTSHMLAAILQQAGYKTGLYTSPHLKDFRERIKINGEMISKQFVIDFTVKTKNLSEDIQPSFFELTVGMAFDYFAQEQVDIAVIETGLGGRLDSTNVINPVVSVITNIGYDHMNLLGNTLEKIASEKAGIIKKDTPVVIGEWLPETKQLFTDKAKSLNAPIYFATDIYKTSNIQYKPASLQVTVTDSRNHIAEDFELDLNGLYQAANLCTVLCVEGILQAAGFSITGEQEKAALKNVKKLTGLHGRWEVLKQNPTLIIDVAHNEDGIRSVLKNLQQLKVAPVNTHFVMGMVNDKDVDKVLSLLPPGATYYFCNAHIPRAMPFEELKNKAEEHGLKGKGYDDVNEAIKTALGKAKPGETIIVCGSVFVVGEVNSGLF
jgi:dihydrofolate synthase/folylpolyglutamate synthase